MSQLGSSRSIRDLALGAAIEIEHLQAGREAELPCLRELVDVLKASVPKDSPQQVGPLKLFPAYRRALAATTQSALNSRVDISRQFKETLSHAEQLLEGQNVLHLSELRAFCIELHSALLVYASEDLVSAPIEERRLERSYG
ncbi:MAG: hypothetical protein AB7L90_26085 [Hyphomicrobiaceae bacterium]|uniref:hypothetical protein n=1 Tax=Pseudorhodoplanes sp. TaxID=1934341 RepID=UPI003D0BE757